MAALNDPNCAELMAQALEIQVKSLNDQIALLRGYVPPAAVVAEVEDGGKKKRKPKRMSMEVLTKTDEEIVAGIDFSCLDTPRRAGTYYTRTHEEQ